MSAIPVVVGLTSSGDLLVQGVVEDQSSGISQHQIIHHVGSKNHFEVESWSGEHEEHEHHPEERRDSLIQDQETKKPDEDTPIASSEHFERKRTPSLAAALLEIDPHGVPLIHFFHPATDTPLLETEEDAVKPEQVEIEEAGESEKVISSLLFLLREMKMKEPEKYTIAVQRLKELEAELRAAGAVTPADPAVSDAVARALAASGPGRDIQIRVNQSRHTTTTKTVYETETPGMAGLDPEKIRELHQQMLTSITPSEHTESSADSGTTQKKETAEEGFTNEDGSVVVSKKMTRVVTTTKSTLPGEGETAPDSPTESFGSVKERIARFESLKEGDRTSVVSTTSSGSEEREPARAERSPFERIPVDIVVTPVSPIPPGQDEEDDIVEAQEPLSPSVEEVSQAEVKSLDSYGEEKEPLSLETDKSSTADILPNEPDSARKHKKREILEQSTSTTYDFKTSKEDRRRLQQGAEGEYPEENLEHREEEYRKDSAVESPTDEDDHHRAAMSEAPGAHEPHKRRETTEHTTTTSYDFTTTYEDQRHLQQGDEGDYPEEDLEVHKVEHKREIALESPVEERHIRAEIAEVPGTHEPHKKREIIEHTTTTVYDFTKTNEDRRHLQQGEEEEEPEEHGGAFEQRHPGEKSAESPVEGDRLHRVKVAREVQEQQEVPESSSAVDKLKGFAKGAGKVAAGVVTAPVAMAVVGAAAAYDKLKGRDSDEEGEPAGVARKSTEDEETRYEEPYTPAEEAEGIQKQLEKEDIVSESVPTPRKSVSKEELQETIRRQYDFNSEEEKAGHIPTHFVTEPSVESPTRSDDYGAEPGRISPEEEKEEQKPHAFEGTSAVITESVDEASLSEKGSSRGEEEAGPRHIVETTTIVREYDYEPAEQPSPLREEIVHGGDEEPIEHRADVEEQTPRHTIETTTITREYDVKSDKQNPPEDLGTDEGEGPESSEGTIEDFHMPRHLIEAAKEQAGLSSDESLEGHNVVETTMITTERFYDEPEVEKQELLSPESEQELPHTTRDQETPEPTSPEAHHVHKVIETTTVTRDRYEEPEVVTAATEFDQEPEEEQAVIQRTTITTETICFEEPQRHSSVEEKPYAKAASIQHEEELAFKESPNEEQPYEEIRDESDGEGVKGKLKGFAKGVGKVIAAPVALAAVGAAAAYHKLKRDSEEDESSPEEQKPEEPPIPAQRTTHQEPAELERQPSREEFFEEQHNPDVIETTTVTREFYEEPETSGDAEHKRPHHIVETTTTTREYYEQPVEEDESERGSIVTILEQKRPEESEGFEGIFGETPRHPVEAAERVGESPEEEKPHHVVETTTVVRESFNDPESLHGQVEEGEPGHHRHHIVETTTVKKETFYEDEPKSAEVRGEDYPEEEGHLEEQHVPHHKIETTTITSEYYKEPERSEYQEPKQLELPIAEKEGVHFREEDDQQQSQLPLELPSPPPSPTEVVEEHVKREAYYFEEPATTVEAAQQPTLHEPVVYPAGEELPIEQGALSVSPTARSSYKKEEEKSKDLTSTEGEPRSGTPTLSDLRVIQQSPYFDDQSKSGEPHLEEPYLATHKREEPVTSAEESRELHHYEEPGRQHEGHLEAEATSRHFDKDHIEQHHEERPSAPEEEGHPTDHYHGEGVHREYGIRRHEEEEPDYQPEEEDEDEEGGRKSMKDKLKGFVKGAGKVAVGIVAAPVALAAVGAAAAYDKLKGGDSDEEEEIRRQHLERESPAAVEQHLEQRYEDFEERGEHLAPPGSIRTEVEEHDLSKESLSDLVAEEQRFGHDEPNSDEHRFEHPVSLREASEKALASPTGHEGHHVIESREMEHGGYPELVSPTESERFEGDEQIKDGDRIEKPSFLQVQEVPQAPSDLASPSDENKLPLPIAPTDLPSNVETPENERIPLEDEPQQIVETTITTREIFDQPETASVDEPHMHHIVETTTVRKDVYYEEPTATGDIGPHIVERSTTTHEVSYDEPAPVGEDGSPEREHTIETTISTRQILPEEQPEELTADEYHHNEPNIIETRTTVRESFEEEPDRHDQTYLEDIEEKEEESHEYHEELPHEHGHFVERTVTTRDTIFHESPTESKKEGEYLHHDNNREVEIYTRTEYHDEPEGFEDVTGTPDGHHKTFETTTTVKEIFYDKHDDLESPVPGDEDFDLDKALKHQQEEELHREPQHVSETTTTVVEHFEEPHRGDEHLYLRDTSTTSRDFFEEPKKSEYVDRDHYKPLHVIETIEKSLETRSDEPEEQALHQPVHRMEEHFYPEEWKDEGQPHIVDAPRSTDEHYEESHYHHEERPSAPEEEGHPTDHYHEEGVHREYGIRRHEEEEPDYQPEEEDEDEEGGRKSMKDKLKGFVKGAGKVAVGIVAAPVALAAVGAAAAYDKLKGGDSDEEEEIRRQHLERESPAAVEQHFERDEHFDEKHGHLAPPGSVEEEEHDLSKEGLAELVEEEQRFAHGEAPITPASEKKPSLPGDQRYVIENREMQFEERPELASPTGSDKFLYHEHEQLENENPVPDAQYGHERVLISESTSRTSLEDVYNTHQVTDISPPSRESHVYEEPTDLSPVKEEGATDQLKKSPTDETYFYREQTDEHRLDKSFDDSHLGYSEEKESPAEHPHVIDSEEHFKEHLKEPLSPCLPKRESEEELGQLIQTTTTTREIFYDEPEEGQFEEGRQPTESTTTTTRTYLREPTSEEEEKEPSEDIYQEERESVPETEEDDLRRVVETFTTQREYYPDVVVGEQTEEQELSGPRIVETVTTTKESFYEEPSVIEEEKGRFGEEPQEEGRLHHIRETTMVTNETFYDEQPGAEEGQTDEQDIEGPSRVVETTTTTKEKYFDEPSPAAGEKEATTEHVATPEEEHKSHHAVETTTTVRTTTFEEPDSPHASQEALYHGETSGHDTTIPVVIETTTTKREVFYDEQEVEELPPAEHVIESESYTTEAQYEEPATPVVKERQIEEAKDYQQGLESAGSDEEEPTSPTKKKKGLGSKLIGFAKKAGVAVAAPVALAAKGASSAIDALKHKDHKDIQGQEVMHDQDERVYTFEGHDTENESAPASPETAKKIEEEVPHMEEPYLATHIREEPVVTSPTEEHIIPSEEYEKTTQSQFPLDVIENRVVEDQHVIESEPYESERAPTTIIVDTVADEEEEEREEKAHVIPSTDFYPSHYDEQIRIDSRAEQQQEEEEHVIESTPFQEYATAEAVHEPEELRTSPSDRRAHQDVSYGEEEQERPSTPASSDSRIIHDVDEEQYLDQSLKQEEHLLEEPYLAAHMREEPVTSSEETRESHHFEGPEKREEEYLETETAPRHSEESHYHHEERPSAPEEEGHPADHHHEEGIHREYGIRRYEEEEPDYQPEEEDEDEEGGRKSMKDKLKGFVKGAGKVAVGIVAAPVALAAVGAAAAYDKLKGGDSDEEEEIRRQHLERESPAAVEQHFERDEHFDEKHGHLAPPGSIRTEVEEHDLSKESLSDLVAEEQRFGHEELEHPLPAGSHQEERALHPFEQSETPASVTTPASPVQEEHHVIESRERQLEDRYKLSSPTGSDNIVQEDREQQQHLEKESTVAGEHYRVYQHEEEPLHKNESISRSSTEDIYRTHQVDDIPPPTPGSHVYEESSELSPVKEDVGLPREEKPVPEDKPVYETDEDLHEPRQVIETTTITRESHFYEEPSDLSPMKEEAQTPSEEEKAFYDETCCSPQHLVESTTMTTKTTYFDEPGRAYPVDEEKTFEKEPERGQQLREQTSEERYEPAPVEEVVHQDLYHVAEPTPIDSERHVVYEGEPDEAKDNQHLTASVISGYTASGDPINTGLVHSGPPSPARHVTQPGDYCDQQELQLERAAKEHDVSFDELRKEAHEFVSVEEGHLHPVAAPRHDETNYGEGEQYPGEEESDKDSQKETTSGYLEEHHDKAHLEEPFLATHLREEPVTSAEEDKKSHHFKEQEKREEEQLESEVEPRYFEEHHVEEHYHHEERPSAPEEEGHPVDHRHEEGVHREYGIRRHEEEEPDYQPEEEDEDEEGGRKSMKDKLKGFVKGAGKVAVGIVAAPVALAAVGAAAAYDKLKGDSDEEKEVERLTKENPAEHRFEEHRETSASSKSSTTLSKEHASEKPGEHHVEGRTKQATTVNSTISYEKSPSEQKPYYEEEKRPFDSEEETDPYPEQHFDDYTTSPVEYGLKEEEQHPEERLCPETKMEISHFVTDVVEEATAGAVIEAAEDLTPRSQRGDHQIHDLEELALENVTRMRFEEEPDNLQSPEKQSEEHVSSDRDESRLIAGDDEWKVYDSTGHVVEEFSAQLTDRAIEDAGTDVTEVFLRSSPASARRLLTQESMNEVTMEPEVDYQSDLQEKLDILAGQKSELLPMVREEELDVIHESEGESEEHDPIVETATRLVDEVIETVLEERDGPKTSSDYFYTATEKSKEDQYDTCVTSQEDTFETAQGWTSQDSEYTTATSEAPSRLSELEERTEGTSTPQAALSPVDSDRQFVVDLDRDPRPVLSSIRSFTLDDETARSTPDVALQITIEEEDENDESLATSPSGVLLAPHMDPGRPVSPVPPRKHQTPEDNRRQTPDEEEGAFVFVARDRNRELRTDISIDTTETHVTPSELSDDSARYTRHSSDVSSHADTVIHREQERDEQSVNDEQLPSTFESQVGSTDSLDKASVKSTGRISSGSSIKAPEEPREPEEKESPKSQDLSPEQTNLSPHVESPHVEHQDLATEEGFVIYHRDGDDQGELETVEEEPEDADSLNGGSGNSSVGAPASLAKYKHVSSDNVSLTSLQEFERLEQLITNKGDSSLTASEVELYASGRPRSMEGSMSSLAEFERLEQEMAHQANQSPHDEMMLSIVKEESETEDMSIRDDDEEEAFSETEIKSVPVKDEERVGTPQAISPSDSLERDVISNVVLMETSADSLEPSFQQKPSGIMVDSLTEYEVVPRMDSTRDSLENIPMDKDSLLEVSSQEPTSQDTHGILSGDTVGSFQEHDDDDKDSLGGEMESMLLSYPTTLTTFETTAVAPDGSIQTISRRVETRVVDPVISHVTFTGTESQERLNQLPLEQPIDTVDAQGNVTRTLFKRQPPHSE